ncbi:hypothetical protein [Gordonia terrae]|uniref:SMP-30/Gluconolactonase/LRE-like region domain-containing protein n=1 Tax=Gordonia terrae NBRC 100016 TaxID=1089454 RepID=A0ABQ0HI74_9ACTN|nr:hypothetical protein [Gordonia terrae]ANY25228.1 hypothetical protein BCM27_22595 [Gordonia terrae]GAB45577.1 hypothetical protein GOTRE_125_02150 [Gordonia terrae NBRC 100016]VTR08108.1 Uncharacterised protein [Clostridioides difficile]
MIATRPTPTPRADRPCATAPDTGEIWVHYVRFAPDPRTPVCDGNYLFRFAPNGTLVGGRPLTGGGLSGAGYGITRNHDGDIWVSNFGFAAPAPGCPTDRQPPHNSMSEFSADGRALSPATGYPEGAISWPQGMATDRNGRALRAPITGPQVDNPLGLATDARGTVWVTNSGVITLPCPDRPTQTSSSSTRRAISGRRTTGKRFRCRRTPADYMSSPSSAPRHPCR